MRYRTIEIEEFFTDKEKTREIVDLMENNGAHLKVIYLKKHEELEAHMSHTDTCIYVTDGEIELIFPNDDFKRTYLRILKKYVLENNIKIIAFCIMGTHAHMLLKPAQIPALSKCMRQVNSTYAAYYNNELSRVGYVFRDRFRAEEIYEYSYLFNCIKYIHMNPVKSNICAKQSEYAFSSYNNYLKKTGFVTSELLKELFPNTNEYYRLLDKSMPKYDYLEEPLSLEEGKIWFENYLKNKNLTYDMLKNNNGIQNQAILDLKKECGLKNIEIANIIGLDKSRITRILNNN